MIEPTKDKPLSYFLRSEILGLPLNELGKPLNSNSLTLVQVAENQKLALRFFDRAKGALLPPDLLSLQLSLERTNPSEKRFGILDCDHYVTYPSESPDFDIADVLRRFDGLHQVLDKAFVKAVTPEAIMEWK
jgi:uncharacterized protein (TIGR04255 family)